VSAGALAAAGAAVGSSIGYPVLFGGVLLGSIVPVVPTGAVVGAGAAFAVAAHELNLAAVVLLVTLGAWAGDVVTFAICRFGGPAAVRWVGSGQHATGSRRPLSVPPARPADRRRRPAPARRPPPVLLAAGALPYPWRRRLPASLLAAFLWAVAYASLGMLSGGIFDSPLLAVLLATALVLVVGALLKLAGSHRRRTPEPETTVVSRDVVLFALLEDMLAGRPVAYADFLRYDEVAHHGGLERADSLAVLRSIDQQIGRLHRAARLAPREYHLVCSPTTARHRASPSPPASGRRSSSWSPGSAGRPASCRSTT
jgi:membrane protein DedA with SNARE-associated domain